jgi:hypothetical protein
VSLIKSWVVFIICVSVFCAQAFPPTVPKISSDLCIRVLRCFQCSSGGIAIHVCPHVMQSR